MFTKRFIDRALTEQETRTWETSVTLFVQLMTGRQSGAVFPSRRSASAEMPPVLADSNLARAVPAGSTRLHEGDVWLPRDSRHNCRTARHAEPAQQSGSRGFECEER